MSETPPEDVQDIDAPLKRHGDDLQEMIDEGPADTAPLEQQDDA